MRHEAGGAFAKLLGTLVLIAVVASAGLYLYTKHQHPIATGAVHVSVGRGPTDPQTIVARAGDQIWIATIVRNTGRLPVRLDSIGVSPHTPWRTSATGLGDGTDPRTVAAFTPVVLDPGRGVGVVIAISLDPKAPCAKLHDPEQLPALSIAYSSYGVSSTQTVPLDGTPPVTGLTATCRSFG